MGAILVPVILVVLVVVLFVLATRGFSRREVEHADRLQTSAHSLRYEVPPGQDPTVVLHHLESEGYDVSPDSEPGPSSPYLVIASQDAGAPDREAVRHALAVLDETTVNPDDSGHVEPRAIRFADE